MVILTYIKITDTGRWHKNYWIVIPIRANLQGYTGKASGRRGRVLTHLQRRRTRTRWRTAAGTSHGRRRRPRSRVREGVPPGLPPLLGCAAWDPRRARVRRSSWAGGMRHLKSRRRRRRRIEPRIAVWAACQRGQGGGLVGSNMTRGWAVGQVGGWIGSGKEDGWWASWFGCWVQNTYSTPRVQYSTQVYIYI